VARKIPIRNLYYLLCYAWNALDEKDDALVAELDGLTHVELLAKVLAVSAQRLWRRGLDRGYRTLDDETSFPRGRIDVQRTVARQLEPIGRAACRFDELGHDVLHNQILATTARRLSRLPTLVRDLREEMVAIDRTLADVSTIPLRAATFTQVQLHGRLRRYRLALHICELVHDQLVIDERTRDVHFRDFVEDPKKMPLLFEQFVRNFYRRELSGWSIKRDDIAWNLVPLTAGASDYLPKMQTDISLRGEGRTIIVDTKFYAEAFTSHYESEKLRPAHLYQLTAYLRNIAAKGGHDANAAGVLLYPEVNPIPSLQYMSEGHRLTATGVDLTADWRAIHQRLIEIVASAS
jgi:5-methylcytosine-specific restriction enzyme subunit McrC